MKNIRVLFALMLLSFLMACEKGETGDVGPVGVAGAKGSTGDKGDVGIANSKGMTFSTWIEVKSTDWGMRASNIYFVPYTLPGLTAQIANKGNVYFYMQPSGSNFVYPLPYLETNGVRFVAELNNTVNTQNFIINYVLTSASTPKVSSNYKFRVVITPAGARIPADVDMQNYDSVKKHLNLKD